MFSYGCLSRLGESIDGGLMALSDYTSTEGMLFIELIFFFFLESLCFSSPCLS